MTLWRRYTKIVELNVFGNTVPVVREIAYWRDRLFANMIIYLLPLSLLAYVPGMIMCYVSNEPYIALFDTIVFLLLIFIAFSRGLSLRTRKLLFVGNMYLLAFTLLYFMGLFGPGLMYLLACVIIVSLVYPAPKAYYAVAVNFLTCLFFAVAIYFEWTRFLMPEMVSVGAWMGVCANELLLSIIFAGAIQLLTNGLQQTISREENLLNQQRNEGYELRKMVAELKMKNEELEQFAYIASHDLQEPLNTISGLVEVLKIEERNPEKKDFSRGLNYISSSAERLRMLIRGLLDYSRLGASLHLREINCAKLIRSVLKDLEALIKGSGAEVHIDRSVYAMPSITACPLNLNQLFQNLISNALKFRKPGVTPKICIGVTDTEDAWHFSIEDNGIGIDSSQQEKIFVIFKRAHGSRMFEGTGIGLAFCKKIVELHGGRIWVSSVPMEGSTFHFLISKSLGPVMDPAGSPSEEEIQETAATQGEQPSEIQTLH